MSSENKNKSRGKTYCFCAKYSSFFWQNLDANEATKMLLSLPEGSYLLRPSQHPSYEYTLSQKESKNQVVHIRIKRDESGRYLLDTDNNDLELQVTPFCCISNLIKSWSRICRDVAKKPLNPVSNTSETLSQSYVNEEKGNVCFYEDKVADESFYQFFLKLST